MSYKINDMTLFADWIASKEAEKEAVEYRRLIEDRISELSEIKEDFEGTNSFETDGYKVKIVGRITRKVDSEILQEVAAENGLTEHLSTLFRWSADINANAWKNASESITGQLSKAITSKPGRPSYSIEKIGE